MLGAILTNAFKDHVELHLHSFPAPNVRSGSFVYDISLNHKDWVPSALDKRTFSAEMVKLAAQNLNFERLEIGHDLAFKIFQDNPFKREQLPNISKHGNNPETKYVYWQISIIKNLTFFITGSVVLYRVGTHIDISRGPMISSTGHLGRVSITAAHQIGDEMAGNTFYRVQGVALPTDIIINHFAYNILEKRSENLVQYFIEEKKIVNFF